MAPLLPWQLPVFALPIPAWCMTSWTGLLTYDWGNSTHRQLSKDRIYNLQFSVTWFPGWGGRAGTRRKAERKKAKRRKCNFKCIHDVSVPPCGCGECQSYCRTAWYGAKALTFPLLGAAGPPAAAWPGSCLFSATGQDIPGLLEVGAPSPQRETLALSLPHKQNSLEPK